MAGRRAGSSAWGQPCKARASARSSLGAKLRKAVWIPYPLSDYDAITKTIQPYIDGAKSGRGADMKPAFHKEATIFGYAGTDLVAGPIQKLFEWNDQNGPATGLQARIASIDIIGTVASVRLELDNWTDQRYTDLFTMLKVDGEWKIMNKVFDLHP